MSWLSNIDKKQLALHVFFICLVGVVSAFTSIVLCICVNTSYRLNQEYSWLVFLLPVLGIVTLAFYKAMKLSYFYSTDDMVMEMRENKPVSPTLAPAILVGTCLSTLGGGAVGKESSAFQMGASIGETLSRAFKLKNVFKNKQDRNVYGYAALMGMSATFSALFFAPLGAVFLVFELTHFKTFSPARFIALLVSAFIAASIAYPFGIGDIIPRVAIPGVTPDLMLQVVLIGTLGGILGRFFGASLAAVRAWERKRLNHPYLSVLVVGIGITILVVAFGLQSFEGGGMNLLKQAASGSIGTWDFAIKAGLVFLALGSGFKGGEIMPTLVIGGLLGCSLGQLINVDPAFATAIGVMTFFAGMTRCPIAAFFLGFEVFGVEIIPFLAVSLIFAYGASHDSGYYGKGIRLNFHSARRRQRLAKQFIENAGDVDSALAKLEEQANEFATEKEQAARKEARGGAQASDPTAKPPNDAASHS
ncbi:MAG: chloride channel protein [Eggerthella sp.]|nr:chloride channel protein [Eggerthella sp.]